jgi:hypothetical protein
MTVKTIERIAPTNVRIIQRDFDNQLELFRKNANPWADVVSAKVDNFREGALLDNVFMLS